ncbi:MAG: helix-turn-helix domain-containing protein [Treponema sp.]|jgi:excisionase family DNA binding protein|nr:helix-turn-helix domain-containing protein [Treponema sp.]
MNESTKPLDVIHASEYLGLKPSYIYNLVHFGKLTAYKPGGKKLFFKISDLEAFVYDNQVGKCSDRASEILNAAQRKKPRKKAKA